MIAPVVQADIKIGEHVQRQFLGMTFNMDTIWALLVAGTLVTLLGFWARKQLTKDTEDHVPTKLQLMWETVLDNVNVQVEDTLGHANATIVAIATAEFFFILICNWMEIIPSEINDHLHLLPAPTADTNLTYAMALFVMVGVWTFGIRTQGAKAYFSHFVQPYKFLLPLNIIEEITKPISLALRLFGNIFAGGIMLSLITLIPIYVMWAPNVLWKTFGGIIAVIQAFIFALLTVLYFAMASAGHDDEEHDEEQVEHDRRSEDNEPATVSAR